MSKDQAKEHLESAQLWLYPVSKNRNIQAAAATCAIAEALTGILELMIDITGDNGTVIDVRAEVRS